MQRVIPMACDWSGCDDKGKTGHDATAREGRSDAKLC